LGFGDLHGQVPGQEFLDAVDRVIGDAREHLAQVCFWVQAVELCCPGSDAGGERAAALYGLIVVLGRKNYLFAGMGLTLSILICSSVLVFVAPHAFCLLHQRVKCPQPPQLLGAG
jgi:hypothetical protein